MKVLLLNNFHYLRGGAERAYFDTAEILRSHGHEVAFFSMQDPKNEPTKWSKYFVDNIDYNDSGLSVWRKIKAAQRFIYNFQSKRNLEKLLAEFRPDVAHLHNVYHQLSPSVIHVLKKNNIPMVMTMHDYNLISPNYNLFLNGKIWEKNSLLACIKDSCIKQSYAKSFINALEVVLNKILRTYKNIGIFISPSMFLIDKFQEFNFKGKALYIPNPLEKKFFENSFIDDTTGPLVYFGRLSAEKGISTILLALKNLPEERLVIVGEGPEKNNLLRLTEKLNMENQVDFTGFKSGQELKNILKKAKAIIVPSVWYENMPYSVAESLAMGKIIIASRLGGIPDLISDNQNGFLFEPGKAQDLAKKIAELNRCDRQKIKKAAYESALKFSSENYYKKIIPIYSRAGNLV